MSSHAHFNSCATVRLPAPRTWCSYHFLPPTNCPAEALACCGPLTVAEANTRQQWGPPRRQAMRIHCITVTAAQATAGDKGKYSGHQKPTTCDDEPRATWRERESVDGVDIRGRSLSVARRRRIMTTAPDVERARAKDRWRMRENRSIDRTPNRVAAQCTMGPLPSFFPSFRDCDGQTASKPNRCSVCCSN